MSLADVIKRVKITILDIIDAGYLEGEYTKEALNQAANSDKYDGYIADRCHRSISKEDGELLSKEMTIHLLRDCA